MRVTFMHACDHAMLDTQGKLSIIGIFSSIAAPRFPATHPGMYLAFEIEAIGAEINTPVEAKIDVVDEDGKPAFTIDGQIQMNGKPAPGAMARSSHIIRLPAFQLKKPGQFGINIWLRGKVEGQITLQIHQLAGKATGS